ncbi:hypothetical protein [Microbacterium paludicola]|uniref:hypothetical protein n=1 Tax=Microbacterium paludicola TaxID=300019 RepID=UPI0031D0AA6F
MTSKTRTTDPQLWTYATAPGSPILAPLGISERQLRRMVENRKVDHLKIGHRVFFTDDHLHALVESFTVRAAR